MTDSPHVRPGIFRLLWTALRVFVSRAPAFLAAGFPFAVIGVGVSFCLDRFLGVSKIADVNFWLALSVGLFQTTFLTLGWAAVGFGSIRKMEGETVSASGMIAVGLRRWRPLIAAAFIYSLAGQGFTLVLALADSISSVYDGALALTLRLLAVACNFFLAIVVLRWLLAPYAVVGENLSTLQSLRFSWRISRGNGVFIFFVVALPFLVILGLGYLFFGVPEPRLFQGWTHSVLGWVFQSVFAAILGVTFFYLRRTHLGEGGSAHS